LSLSDLVKKEDDEKKKNQNPFNDDDCQKVLPAKTPDHDADATKMTSNESTKIDEKAVLKNDNLNKENIDVLKNKQYLQEIHDKKAIIRAKLEETLRRSKSNELKGEKHLRQQSSP
jgi:hypothetical protein